jgi:hypothetical protein
VNFFKCDVISYGVLERRAKGVGCREEKLTQLPSFNRTCKLMRSTACVVVSVVEQANGE